MKTLKHYSKKLIAVAFASVCASVASAQEWVSDWTLADGVLSSTNGWSFGASGTLKKLSLGSLKTTGTNGYLDFSSLGMTYVGQRVCNWASGIVAIKFPSSLKTIDHWAFVNMTTLESVDFGEDSELTSLGYDSFSGCSSLKTVTPLLPEKVCSSQCYFNGCPIEGALRIGYGASQNFAISGSSFNGHKLTNVDIGPKVTSIGHWAFQSSGNTTLTNVTMTDNVTFMGHTVFNGCSALKTISPLVPDGLTSIDQSYAYCGVEGTFSFGFGDTKLNLSGSCVRNTKIDTVSFGPNFSGLFSGHWQFGGVSTLKYIDTYGTNVFDFSNNCGAFDAKKEYELLLTVPNGAETWEAVLADAGQVTPWKNLGEKAQAYWTTNFPGLKHPYGLIVTNWTKSTSHLGTGHTLINQWIRRRPVPGMSLIVR